MDLIERYSKGGDEVSISIVTFTNNASDGVAWEFRNELKCLGYVGPILKVDDGYLFMSGNVMISWDEGVGYHYVLKVDDVVISEGRGSRLHKAMTEALSTLVSYGSR